MTGRALAVVAELGADLKPAGWRLTDAPGVDHRRARSLLAQDLDLLEERAQGSRTAPRRRSPARGRWPRPSSGRRGTVSSPTTAPATRKLAQALAEGLHDHVADLRRRVGADLLVQVDEPARRPCWPVASRPRRAAPAPPGAPARLAGTGWVFAAVREAGATPVAHCCAADAPVDLLLGAGAQGVSVDLDALGSALRRPGRRAGEGHAVILGVVPATDPVTPPTDDAVTERVLRVLDMLGLDPRTARAWW